jgi:hypothetical protein
MDGNEVRLLNSTASYCTSQYQRNKNALNSFIDVIPLNTFFMYFMLRTRCCGFGVEPATLDLNKFPCFEPFFYSCLFQFL